MTTHTEAYQASTALAAHRTRPAPARPYLICGTCRRAGFLTVSVCGHTNCPCATHEVPCPNCTQREPGEPPWPWPGLVPCGTCGERPADRRLADGWAICAACEREEGRDV